MLSPLREPVYAASSRTLNGALAEMERLIGDALFAGYVGYNGRAPGGTAVKKEEPLDSSDRYKSGGDARHTLVAYFEIVELASILCVDKETTNLAIRIFRHTASNTSLRNRNVESLATAAFVAAADRRWHEYQQWLKDQKDQPEQQPSAIDSDPNSDDSTKKSPWPVQPRQLSVEEISAAANLDTSEVLRYLKVVNVALRKQRAESNSSITEHIPSFCRRLELPEQTERLAIAIAENAMQKNICSRRNPGSVAAAAIYLACQLDGVRKTQTEICRATPLTEVTLRKVRNELNAERDALLPDWYKADEKGSETSPSLPTLLQPILTDRSRNTPSVKNEIVVNDALTQQQDTRTSDSANNLPPSTLVPPPLPPGFGERLNKGSVEGSKTATHTPNATPQASQPRQESSTAMNPLLAMMNNPAMQAFANPVPMMPQFMMPPPPPPLPPSIETTNAKEKENPDQNEPANANTKDETMTESAGENKNPSDGKDQNNGTGHQPPADVMAGMQSMMGMMQAMSAFQAVQQPPAQGTDNESISKDQSANKQQPADMMASMQSMMGMMQAMHAFQAMQQTTQKADGSNTAQNPWAMMANAFAQAQPGPATFGTLPNPDLNKPNTSGEVDREESSTAVGSIDMSKESAKREPETSNGES